jgi:alpha-L-fucosidase
MHHPLPLPTPEQVEWADCEIGVIIHLDLQVFVPDYDFRALPPSHPAPSVFAPTALDTDQWLATAKAGGAQYAVLVAKHGTGFSLWPTDAHDYSVKHSPWKDGKGDLVADFIASCAKYGIRPGLYYHCGCNGYCGVDNPGRALSGQAEDQQRYNRVVTTQLTELWTRYGTLFEIWFDGGTLPPELGGPEVIPLLQAYQPQAVCFQGPRGTRSVIRWAGNELGYVDYPCWNTTRWKPARTEVPHIENAPAEHTDAEFPMYGQGEPDGALWAPAENDMTLRRQDVSAHGGWIWRRGQDHLLYPLEEQIERYYHCVGRNANLLAGLVVDDRGLVPEVDVALWTAFGAEIRRRFAHPVGETRGTGGEILLTLDGPYAVNHAVLMEEIAQGERVRQYVLEGETAAGWQPLATGACIGHKHIQRFERVVVSRLRLRLLASMGEPQIRRLAAYLVV